MFNLPIYIYKSTSKECVTKINYNLGAVSVSDKYLVTLAAFCCNQREQKIEIEDKNSL